MVKIDNLFLFLFKQKNEPLREDVRLMIECSNVDTNKDDDNDDFLNDDDDDEDDEVDDTGYTKISTNEKGLEGKSDDDDEMWYDSMPHHFELQPMAGDSFGLLDSAVRTVDETEAKKTVTFARRSGSIIKDDGFESIPLKR